MQFTFLGLFVIRNGADENRLLWGKQYLHLEKQYAETGCETG